jgi:hypothetical protein
VFKLLGDRLTATSAITRHIPTSSIPAKRVITLRSTSKHSRKQDLKNVGILVVPKQLDVTGKRKWRICVELRKLRDIMLGDSFPIHNILNIVDKFGRDRYFSALDCVSGYWQIPSAEEDRPKTVFSTSSFHYEYISMPFGVKSGASTFQKLMM